MSDVIYQYISDDGQGKTFDEIVSTELEFLCCWHVEKFGARPSRSMINSWIERLKLAYDRGVITEDGGVRDDSSIT